MKTKVAKKTVSIRMDLSLLEALQAEVEKQDRTITWLIKDAVRQVYAQPKKNGKATS